MIIHFEQLNARGEGSRPRVDLNALARSGPRRPGRRDATRPARGRGRSPRPRGQGPGNRPDRSAPRSPVGPGPIAAPHAMHQEMNHMPRPNGEHRRREDPTSRRSHRPRDLMDELLDRGFSAASSRPSPTRGGPSRPKPRRSRPSTPRSSRRSWSVAAGSVSRPTDPTPATQPQPPPPARPVVPAGAEGGHHAPGESPRCKSPSRSTKLGWPGPRTCGRRMALLAGLEDPPPRAQSPVGRRRSPDPPDPDDDEEPSYPEGRAPARTEPDRGDAWEPDDRAEQDSPPTDGRQLLGWAGKQVPDMKGPIIGCGKKKGLHSKIVEWTPQQVAAAYRFARGRLGSTTR